MAKHKKPYDGLTAEEFQEVKTLERQVQSDEAADRPDPVPEPRMAIPEPAVELPTADQIALLEAEIVKTQARIFTLQHPTIEYPKMVKGRTFQTKAERDAAGPEWAD